MFLKEMKSASIILERGACSWGRCYFCGWGKRFVDVTEEELRRKFTRFLEKNVKRRKVKVVKIFSSGSFLDEKQFSRDFVKFCIEKAKEAGAKAIVIESRPEFVQDSVLEYINVEGIEIHVAIGLELADDEVLLKYYRKGLSVRDYLRAVETLKRHAFKVRTYILVNGHPILQDLKLQREILEKTMDLVLKVSDTVVIINAYPHMKSELWEDWINLKWKPLDEEQFMDLVKEWINDPRVEIDFNNLNFIPRFPKEKMIYLKGVGREYLVHPYYEVWQDYFVRFYKPPPEKEYLLFVPCSYKKPYTRSRTWRAFLGRISGFPFFKKIHVVAVSSPGVIPYEYINYYPFNAYDWPEWLETPKIKKEYIEVTAERVKKYIEKHGHRYKLFFVYLRPDSESIQAIRKAFKQLKLENKLIETLPEEVYQKIKEFKPALAHPDAVEELVRTLKMKIK